MSLPAHLDLDRWLDATPTLPDLRRLNQLADSRIKPLTCGYPILVAGTSDFGKAVVLSLPPPTDEQGDRSY